MENQKDPLLSHEDELKAENNLLKLKLGLEYGMKMDQTSTLTPDVENQWLKNVYAFEQQYKDAKRTTLYEYLGRPSFDKWDTLNAAETSEALKRIKALMSRNDVALDCICDYDDHVIYRFITEELFGKEMDDMRIPGMVWHFVYEEFYPNHDYDLRRHTTDFINSVFNKTWNEEFDGLALARNVSFLGNRYDRAGISSIITTFQEAHDPFQIEMLDIREVIVDPGVKSADVRGYLSISEEIKRGDFVWYEGDCAFHFIREDDFWYISGFSVPGFKGG